MNYRHRFQVEAPLSKVAGFHHQAASMAAITPPPLRVEMLRTPDILTEGSEMEFKLKLGPLGIPWLARIEGISENGFTDRQLRGPFVEWVHRHSFESVDAKTTMVVDTIQLKLRRELFWKLVGLGMWMGLPVLFAFRGWKTRRLLI